MSRTSLVRAQGVRDGTEQRVTENYAATLAENLYDKEVSDRTAAITAAVAAEAALRAGADTRLQTNINNEATARANADNAEATTRANADNEIANGTRTITPNLAPGTKQNGNDISMGLEFLRFVDYGNNTPSNPPDYILPTYYLDGDMFFYTPSDYGGYSTLAAMAAAVATLNGNDTVNGSVDKKVKDAVDAFASAITEDGTINTYKEVLDWIAAHGADFAALVGQVNTNTGRIATLETNMPTSATAAEIREAWNPTPEPEPKPVTPTVTISGAYDADSETLVIGAEDMAKLEALNVQELFDLVINATGVEYSGPAKTITTITTITTSLTQEEPIYEFRSSIPLWDTEYNYNRFNDCYIISHYDSTDAGEIGGGQW